MPDRGPPPDNYSQQLKSSMLEVYMHIYLHKVAQWMDTFHGMQASCPSRIFALEMRFRQTEKRVQY